MKKHFLLISSIILLFFSSVSAQYSPISGGVLNGKAESLPKPSYPPAARAVNAEGAVNIRVTIDEEGNVISAEAVSGHPLLREASRAAALQAKFKPTLLSGQAVKVSGIIVYNFVGETTQNWFKVGYDLANVQHAPLLISLNTNAIGKLFQPDWTIEKEQLQKLEEIKQAEAKNGFAPTVAAERKISETTEKKPDGTTVKKVVTEQMIKSDTENNPEQINISQSLIAALQSRLGSDELSLWQFNTGVSFSFAVSKLRFSNERQRVLDSLRQQIQTAPENVSPDIVAELQKALAILEKTNPTAEDRDQMRMIMAKLFSNK